MAGLWWMEVKFLNQNPCIPSKPGVFQIGTFLSIALRESRCIFAFRPSSGPYNSFCTWFIHLACLLWSLRSHILLLNSFVLFAFVLGRIFTPSPLLAGIFFRCLRMTCFLGIVLSCLDICLVFLLSLLPSSLFNRFCVSWIAFFVPISSIVLSLSK